MTLCVRRGSWSESAHNRIKEAGRETNRIQGEDKERLKEWEKKELRLRKEREGGSWWVEEVIKDRSSLDLPPRRCQVRPGSGAVGGQYLAGSSAAGAAAGPAAQRCERRVC